MYQLEPVEKVRIYSESRSTLAGFVLSRDVFNWTTPPIIPGENVTFEVTSNDKGLVAVRVEVDESVPVSVSYAVPADVTAFDSQHSVNAVQPVTFNATGNLTNKEVTSNEFTK